MTKQQRARLTLKLLSEKYKNHPPTGLTNWKEPWQYLFCVILSAQANDDQINKVSNKLFQKYTTLEDFIEVSHQALERIIKTAGFFKVKASYLKRTAKILLAEYKGKVPSKLSQLIELPGVGRKTANVFQGVILGKSEGIAVDTHVARTSRRLKLTSQKAQDKIEQDLMKLFPKSKYQKINPILFWHGRTICMARKPQCEKCELNSFCPSAFTV